MSINVIRADIRAMSAYPVPVLDNDVMKLDAMEVPYLLPENLRQELAQQLANAPINRYPNPASSGLQSNYAPLSAFQKTQKSRWATVRMS